MLLRAACLKRAMTVVLVALAGIDGNLWALIELGKIEIYWKITDIHELSRVRLRKPG